MPAEGDDAHHQGEVEEIDGKEILPLERKELVDSQTGESPLEPNDDERKRDGLADKPDGSGNIVHHGVETVPTGNVEGHPAAEEEEGCHACHDKEIEVFGEVEEAEVNT